MLWWSVARTCSRPVVGLRKPRAAVVIADGEYPPQKSIAPVRLGVREILHVDIDLGIAVHVKDALVRAPEHGGDVPASLAVMRVDSIKTALRNRESEVTHQPLRHTIWLKPGQRRVLRLCLNSFNPFDTADPDVLVGGGIVPDETLF